MKPNFTFIDRLFLCLQAKCTVCAKGHLFKSLWSINSFREICIPVRKCENCGFHFERDSGYYFGCVFPILPSLSIFPSAVFAAISYFYLAMEPNEVAMSTALGAIFGFIVFFRLAVALYIALDHSIRASG